jgi:hypothetical protein
LMASQTDFLVSNPTSSPSSSSTSVSESIRNRECVVCLTDVADHVILECMHMCLCYSCVASKKFESCPLCRCIVTSIKKVF